ncbi:hypothetical protein [Micromonospora sp. NPDC005313]|uniref:hypothetical protein n=1 Tax=Micromonospora sp. NPDC005313 TaxID=3154296 RepID=UPI0033BECE2B
MTKLSMQFHATQAEVASWVAHWVEEFQLAIAVEVFIPGYRVRPCERDAALDAIRDLPDMSRLVLNLTPMDLAVDSSIRFLRANPDVLTVSLGAQSQDELRETVIGAMTDHRESLKTWRAIIAGAKKSMLKGSIVVNPVTGARQDARGHYYTAGAREMAKRGARLLASVGWNEYHVNE